MKYDNTLFYRRWLKKQNKSNLQPQNAHKSYILVKIDPVVIELLRSVKRNSLKFSWGRQKSVRTNRYRQVLMDKVLCANSNGGSEDIWI